MNRIESILEIVIDTQRESGDVPVVSTPLLLEYFRITPNLLDPHLQRDTMVRSLKVSIVSVFM